MDPWMGERIEPEPHEDMALHRKTDLPCPRCGTPVSLVGANQHPTNFATPANPGMLIAGLSIL